MDGIELTAQQRADAEVIADVLMAKMRVEAEHIAELLASKSNGDLFGATEFQVRDILLGLGAEAFATALEERKKRGTKDPA